MGFYETRKALGELSSLYESSVLSEKKKDDSYLETDMKKRQANNEKARKDLMKGPQMKNPHFEETEIAENRRAARAAGGYKDDSKKQTDPSKAGFTGISGSIADIMRQNKEIEARDKAKTKKEGLDPVGQEDADIDNDGDTDSSDKYLHKRRKAISKAIKAKKKTVKEEEKKIGGGNLKTLAAKATKRIDADVDGDVDTHDPKSQEMGEYVPGPGGKKLKPKVQKEAFHDWRTDLREIISTDDEDQKEVKEKTVKNKVVIDPELKLENFMGGEVLEITESETCPVCGCDPCQCLEGTVDEAVYGGTPEKKKDTRMMVTNADKKANTPAYQRFKAGDKRYKAADHMKEEQVDEEKKPLPKTKMFRKAGNLGRDAISTPIDPEKRQKAYDRSKKIIKTLNQNEEVEMDEAMKPGPRREKMRAKMHDPYVRGGSKSRGQAHNIAVRGDVSTGDPAIKSRGGGGVKKDKGMGYGDRGAGNKARRRAGQEPLRGTRMREATEDSLRDRRMERGGVDGNTRYDRAPKAPNTKKFGTGKTALQKDMEKKHGKGKSAMDIVRAEIRAKHGKGAIMDTKKK